MAKLVVTADIHGSLSSWLTIKALLNKEDKLVIAGDLFDTKYGNYANSNFKPEVIKQDLENFKNDFFYIYGNCDVPSFSPGFKTNIKFNAFNQQVFLFHGDQQYKHSSKMDIMIQGHTHIYSLKKQGGIVFMNPGSITYPKNGVETYGVIDNTTASIIELKTGNKLISIKLKPCKV
jgi:putative phosphoesterase